MVIIYQLIILIYLISHESLARIETELEPEIILELTKKEFGRGPKLSQISAPIGNAEDIQ